MKPFLSGVCFFVSSGSDHTHSLHVLLLVAILDGRPVIGDDAVVVPRIVEQVMRFIIADEEHAVLVGEPGEILAAVLELPARADDNVAQVDGRPERDRHIVVDICAQQIGQTVPGFVDHVVFVSEHALCPAA